MIKFDKVPVMDREYFNECLERAEVFSCWVQISPAYQNKILITKDQAIQLVDKALYIMPIWANFFEPDRELSISLPSQWLDKLK